MAQIILSRDRLETAIQNLRSSESATRREGMNALAMYFSSAQPNDIQRRGMAERGLVVALQSRDPDIRERAAHYMRYANPEIALPALRAATHDGDESVRRSAAESIREIQMSGTPVRR